MSDSQIDVAQLYEDFIKLAYNYPGNTKTNGAHADFVKLLIGFEQTPKYYKHLKKSYSDYLLEVKDFITKAIDKFLAKDLSELDRLTFLEMKELLPMASSSIGIGHILERGLDYMYRQRKR